MEISEKQLRELQVAELDLLSQFTDWLDAHKIDYWLSWGTALGAVRHKGWIPWDDDIDIDMTVTDINKMLREWKKRGIDGLFLQTQKTDPNLPEIFIRIRKDGTTSMDEEGCFIPLHWGLSIDIFPLMNYPNIKFFQNIQKKLYQRANDLSYYSWYSLKNHSYSKIKHIYCRFKAVILFKIALIISAFSSRSGNYTYIRSDEPMIFAEQDIYPLNRRPFENKQFKMPHNYDKFLRMSFGDYMKLPPENQRKVHQYWILDLYKDFRMYVSYKWRK